MVICPLCGTSNPEQFRFCGQCAAPLAARPERGERRKVVTVLFCDVAGSTALTEQRDPETMRAVMGRYFETVRTALVRHGGTVEKFIGDAAMAVFGHPVLHEDDALRAVRAAFDIRDQLATVNEELLREWGTELAVRIGINTGPVVAGDEDSADTHVTGDAVNVAARLETAAAPGEVVIGAETYELVRDAVDAEAMPALTLKGKEFPVAAWRLLSVNPLATLGRARRLDSKLVGRAREKRLLDEAFEQSIGESSCGLFTLLGSAGVGKSRLVREFLKDVGDQALVLRGRCLPYGEGITFWPLAETIKTAAGVSDEDSAASARAKVEQLCATDPDGAAIARHLCAAIGLSEGAPSSDEVMWSARKFFELLAASRPLVVEFDDIHWAEPAFLDMVDHVADWSRGFPILFVCVARPELLETRSGWAGGKPRATTVLLAPLSGDLVVELISNLLGAGSSAGAISDRIAAAAEGNPLFVEEFVAMLIDDGHLREEDGRWIATDDLDRVPVPPTIRSLLAARIDRLIAAERGVMERASVVGVTFWRGAVAELQPEALRDEVGPSLSGLVRKELVLPDRSDFVGDDAFRFRHLLIRDAAYESLSKRDRAELHEHFADWLARTAGDREVEYEEILGYHLEQAYRYRLELGPLDVASKGVGVRAGRLLASAGKRAVDRGDMNAGRRLLKRSLYLLPSDAPNRAGLLTAYSMTLYNVGEMKEASVALAEAIDVAERLGDERAYWVGVIRRDYSTVVTDLDEALEEAMPALERLGDDEALAEAWLTLHVQFFWRGQVSNARAAAERALHHARLSGDRSREIQALYHLAGDEFLDDTPLDSVISQADRVIELTARQGRQAARALGTRGRSLAMMGRIDDGRSLVLEAMQVAREFGYRYWAAGTMAWVAMVEFSAGRYAAAEAVLRDGTAELEELGDTAYRSTQLGELSIAIAGQGRWEEAEAVSRQAESISVPQDTDAQAKWRAGRALAMGGLGRDDEAEALGLEAVSMFDGLEDGHVRTWLLLELADVLSRGQHRNEVARRLDEAIVYLDRKGATGWLARARAKRAAISD